MTFGFPRNLFRFEKLKKTLNEIKSQTLLVNVDVNVNVNVHVNVHVNVDVNVDVNVNVNICECGCMWMYMWMWMRMWTIRLSKRDFIQADTNWINQ